MKEMVVPTVVVLVLLMYSSSQMKAQGLQVGFYKDKCNDVESIVRQEVEKAFNRNRGIAPGLIRLHFHDCFVGGCEGSILIDSTPNNVAEKDGLPNGISLRGTEVIDGAKSRLESQCKGVVSCADILSFAARDATILTGGIGWDVPAGRRDGRVSLASQTLVDIPAPFFNLQQTTQSFANKGLSQEEMITLAGAHTIGRSHCTSFSNRLYNFIPGAIQDPTLDPFYAALLKRQCPVSPHGAIDPNLVVPMNISPAFMDTSYYRDILVNRGLFTSDQTLISSPDTASTVRLYAFNRSLWLNDFAEAMVKMSQIGVLTGSDGEIRSNCRVINP